MKVFGVVVLKKENAGSKSERLYPSLYLGKGEFIRVYFEDDDPFNFFKARELDGEMIEAEVMEDVERGDYVVNSYLVTTMEEVRKVMPQEDVNEIPVPLPEE